MVAQNIWKYLKISESIWKLPKSPRPAVSFLLETSGPDESTSDPWSTPPPPSIPKWLSGFLKGHQVAAGPQCLDIWSSLRTNICVVFWSWYTLSPTCCFWSSAEARLWNGLDIFGQSSVCLGSGVWARKILIFQLQRTSLLLPKYRWCIRCNHLSKQTCTVKFVVLLRPVSAEPIPKRSEGLGPNQDVQQVGKTQLPWR